MQKTFSLLPTGTLEIPYATGGNATLPVTRSLWKTLCQDQTVTVSHLKSLYQLKSLEITVSVEA